jgi:hypothetical protein
VSGSSGLRPSGAAAAAAAIGARRRRWCHCHRRCRRSRVAAAGRAQLLLLLLLLRLLMSLESTKRRASCLLIATLPACCKHRAPPCASDACIGSLSEAPIWGVPPLFSGGGARQPSYKTRERSDSLIG